MSSDPIGRADYELRAPVEPLKKDLAAADAEIQKTGEATEAEFAKRSSKWGPVVASGMKTGIKAVATTAAGMFAIATKGALQLQEVQAQYQADTGASAEEARRASKVINKAAGDNVASLTDVAEAATRIHNDLGLVGDAADKATGQFTKYARVTRQDAAGAVSAFDDILDAWNLTADDSQQVMDALIVSHQKYGGAVSDDQDALAKLAPVLRAANGTWEDAIGLLDLAKASGLDNADAIAAMTKALSKVKSPEELQKLIDDISSTEDPFLRAQKAAELFGQKAGPKLANALAGKSLKDFKIDMDTVTGATDKAADALDSTFGAKVKKKISEVGATLRSLGDDWGPLLTGAASVTSVLGALGFDTLITKLGPKLAKSLAAVGKQGGEALIDAVGTATGAAGTVVGNLFANRLENIFDPTKNTVLGKMARAAGLKIAAIYLAAEIFTQPLRAAITGAWEKVAGSSAVMRAAALAGGKAGLAFAAGVALVPVVIVGALAFEWQKGEAEKNQADVATAVHDIITKGSIQGMLDARAELEQRLNFAIKADTFKLDLNGTQKSLREQIAAIDAMLGANIPQLRDNWRDDMTAVGEQTGPGVLAGARTSLPNVSRQLPLMLGQALAAPSERMKAITRALGRDATAELAHGILDGYQEPVDAWDRLTEIMKTSMGKTAIAARAIGHLVSADLAKAMHDGDPKVRQAAEATKTIMLGEVEAIGARGSVLSKTAAAEIEKGLRSKNATVRQNSQAAKVAYLHGLEEYVAKGGKLSKSAAAEVEKGLKSKNTQIHNAALKIKSLAEGPLKALSGNGYTYGQGFTKGFIRGLVADIDRVEANAAKISRVVKKYLQVRSPSEKGAFSTMGGPEGWSRHWMRLYAKGLEAGVPRINGILGGLGGTSAPAMSSASAAMAAGGSARNVSTSVTHAGIDLSGATFHLHGIGGDVSPAAAQRFGRQVLEEVARGFKQGSARRGIAVGVRP